MHQFLTIPWNDDRPPSPSGSVTLDDKVHRTFGIEKIFRYHAFGTGTVA